MVLSFLYFHRRIFFIIPYTMILTSNIDDNVPPLWMTFFTRIQSAKKIQRNLCGCFSKTLFEKLFPETVKLPCDICNRHDFIHFEENVGNSKNNFTFTVKKELNINLANELNTTQNDNITSYVPTVNVGSNIKNAFFKQFDHENVYKLEALNEHSNQLNINLANQLNTTKNDNITTYVPTVKVGSNIKNAYFKEFDYENVYKLETVNEHSNEFNRIKQVSFGNNINIIQSIEKVYNPYLLLQYDFKKFDYENVYKLETVNEHSNEFKRITEEFVGNNINRIHSIEKIHNLYLLLQYDLKKLEYDKRGIKYEEKRLFHGTKKSNINGICQRNFNWRLTGHC
ncbi:uncharacterized protein [Diabrotica undecimpunctata]|uniref:uncharacterized protein isoform X2 n=1 Tax=Diabrotica undecimpunctata TaxID=50387 RepID=UPI003B634ECE